MNGKDVERRLLQERWIWLRKRGAGSHRVYMHPNIPGIVTVPWHRNGNADIAPLTLKNIARAALWEDR